MLAIAAAMRACFSCAARAAASGSSFLGSAALGSALAWAAGFFCSSGFFSGFFCSTVLGCTGLGGSGFLTTSILTKRSGSSSMSSARGRSIARR